MSPAPTPDTLLAVVRRHGLWVAVGVVVAAATVLATSYRVELLPPSLERDSAEFAAASTQVLVDFPGDSAVLDYERSLTPLVDRANVYARLAPTPAVLSAIAAEAGLDRAEIDARGPYNPNAPRLAREPTAERRAVQLGSERDLYRLRFEAEEEQAVPIVNVLAQAPTLDAATRLADAGATGLVAYVDGLQREQRVPDDARVAVRQLGAASGAVVNPGVDRQIAVLRFLAVFAGWTTLVLLAAAFARRGEARPRAVGAPVAGGGR